MWLIKAHTSQEAPTSTSGSSSPQQTINKYTQELEKKGYLVKIKQRPLTYTLADKITDRL